MRCALAIVLVFAACGRLGFDDGRCADASDCAADELCTAGSCTDCAKTCDDGNPCTDDSCAGGSCTVVANHSACDDGDACTTSDQCVLGVCGAGAMTGCAAEPRLVVRSVSAGAGTPLALGSGLTITGTTAVFATPLPDKVGVGDVIEYDSDADGTRDSLAFVHRRLSSQVFAVRTSTGGTPTPTPTPSTWAVLRAYLSLANAIDRTRGGTRNPNITAAPFDGYAGGRDLVAANEQWSFACYDDGALDTTGVEMCSSSYTRSCSAGSWTTDATHFVRIYTPTATSEVGTSQRHDGRWGSGYQRTDGIILYEGFVRLDGLSIKRTTNGIGRTYYVETEGHGGEIWISNNFGWNTITGPSKVFDVWGTGTPPLGPTYTILRWWNDIAFNESTTDLRGGFYINSDRAEAYVSNCTAYVKGGGAFYQSTSSRATLKNCLGHSDGNAAFVTDDGFLLVASSVSNDASLLGIANVVSSAWNQTISFANAAGGDLHLAPSAAQNLEIRGKGLDLSGDLTLPFADDIDGEPRPLAAWDVGADQVVP